VPVVPPARADLACVRRPATDNYHVEPRRRKPPLNTILIMVRFLPLRTTLVLATADPRVKTPRLDPTGTAQRTSSTTPTSVPFPNPWPNRLDPDDRADSASSDPTGVSPGCRRTPFTLQQVLSASGVVHAADPADNPHLVEMGLQLANAGAYDGLGLDPRTGKRIHWKVLPEMSGLACQPRQATHPRDLLLATVPAATVAWWKSGRGTAFVARSIRYGLPLAGKSTGASTVSTCTSGPLRTPHEPWTPPQKYP